MTTSKNQEVAMQEKMVAKLQKKYVDRLRAVQDSLNKAKEVKEIGEDAGTWDKVVYSMTHLTDVLERNAKNLAAVAETKISEWINDPLSWRTYFSNGILRHVCITTMFYDNHGDILPCCICSIDCPSMG